MNLSSSFVSSGEDVIERCILCNKTLYNANNKKEKLKGSERTTLKKYALQWYSLDLRVCDSFPYDEFRNASERINSQKGENTFSVHYTCSVSFRNRIKRKQQEESSLNPLQREEPNKVDKNIIVTKRSHAMTIANEVGW